MVKIRPMDDRIVVKVLEAEETTAGGILLPDTAKEKPQRGKVSAVGQGRLLDDGKRAAMTVKKGDVVIFGKYSGSDVEIEGQEFKIMRENEVLLRVES
ncbi:MAG: co-chaperone GroES [Planctomycetota bacterium]